jgi:tRNA(fMet)-specific endonuclease VapC
MPTVLLDTDVVSFILKSDSRATSYTPLIQGNVLAVSFMTVAELFQWAAVRRWGARRRHQLDQALAAYLIVPPDVEMCRIWGNVRGERQAAGQTISPQDAWIAATAIRHQLPLVTHNADDYLNITSLVVRTVAHP